MKQAADAGPDVSRETKEKLLIHVALLRQWNRHINLLARGDEAHIWHRHVADSLALMPLLPPAFTHAIDLGSGAGFPGLVVAIATGQKFHLIEADHRKAAFLREAARATAAPVEVHAARIEALHLPPAPLIIARALAPLSRLLALAAPLLASDGICVFPKGRNAENELTQAAAQWHMRVERSASRTDPAATIFRISEISRVGHRP